MVGLIDTTAIIEYIYSIPSGILSGDVFAVSTVLIGFYLIVLFINKLTGLIIFILKKVFLLTIVSLAFFKFVEGFVIRVGTEGLTQDVVLFGAAGFIAGFIAFMISLYAAFTSLKTLKKSKEECECLEDDKKEQASQEKIADDDKVPAPTTPGVSLTGRERIQGLFSLNNIKNDKALGAVLTYLVIAEFGVFSSKTISAPTADVGMGFFLTFLVAATIFVYQSYKDYITGLKHLAIAVIVGVVLSILLGHYWGNYPLESLLSKEYFASDSLVALVTGLSVSLFMGSKD